MTLLQNLSKITVLVKRITIVTLVLLKTVLKSILQWDTLIGTSFTRVSRHIVYPKALHPIPLAEEVSTASPRYNQCTLHENLEFSCPVTENKIHCSSKAFHEGTRSRTYLVFISVSVFSCFH